MEFKDKIKKLRTELNMTMDELARKVGVSTPTIQRYESGEIKNVRRDKIQLLADALETTPSYLMDWSNDQKPSTHKYELSNAYFSLAKEAEQNNIDPNDIKMAIEMIKKLRGE